MMNSSRLNDSVVITSDGNFQVNIVEIVAICFVMAASLVGNHLIIFAFINNFKMRTVTNSLVVNLCVVDIISVLVDVPFYLVRSRAHPELVQRYVFCRFSLFMYQLTTGAATTSMLCTAVDRYLNLVNTSFRRLCHKKVKIMFAVVWCQAFLMALPWDLLSPSSKSSTHLALFVCQRFPYIYSPGLDILGLSIFLKSWCVIIPLFIIVWVFGRILHFGRLRRKIVVNERSTINHSKTERFAVHSYARSCTTAVFLFTIYLFASTPFLFIVIYTMFVDYTDVSPAFAFTVYYLCRLRGAILPFMYLLRNRNVLVYFERKLKYWYGNGNLEYPTGRKNALERSRSALGIIYRYRQSLGERGKSRTKREQSVKRAVQWQIFYTKQANKARRSSFTDLSSFEDEMGNSKVVIESREILVHEAGTADKIEEKTEGTLTTGVQKILVSELTLPQAQTSKHN